jgi:hypothetical protein
MLNMVEINPAFRIGNGMGLVEIGPGYGVNGLGAYDDVTLVGAYDDVQLVGAFGAEGDEPVPLFKRPLVIAGSIALGLAAVGISSYLLGAAVAYRKF